MARTPGAEGVAATEKAKPRDHLLLRVSDPAELRTRCLADLAGYKVPERFIFVDVLPRNAMAKVDRGALRPLIEAGGRP